MKYTKWCTKMWICAQARLISSKPTIETLGKCVKYVQS